jgi:hypothetical protein
MTNRMNTAADYSKIGLQIPFEQTTQHEIKSLGLQATPSGRQAKDPALAPKVVGVKRPRPQSITRPQALTTKSSLYLFSLQK